MTFGLCRLSDVGRSLLNPLGHPHFQRRTRLLKRQLNGTDLTTDARKRLGIVKMKPRALRCVPLRRGAMLRLQTLPLSVLCARHASSLSQRPNANHVSFPGALKSAFTGTLSFERPESYSALPTYRAVDQQGQVVDASFKPDIPDETVIKLYKDMLFISILDLIMFDAQRQGRISFYMVSAGEEAVSVGSSSVLDKEDVVYCQYREQGVFKERGFTTKDFMSQLLANKNDPGKGRNMPVHYGSKELNLVRYEVTTHYRWPSSLQSAAQHLFPPSDTATAGIGVGLCTENAEITRSQRQAPRHGSLLRRRGSE